MSRTRCPTDCLDHRFSRTDSRAILNSIVFGEPRPDAAALTEQEFRRLRTRYDEIRRSMGTPYSPRNLPFYIAIREMYPEFSWAVSGNDGGQAHVALFIPGYRGRRPSLTDLALGTVKATGSPQQRREAFALAERLADCGEWCGGRSSVLSPLYQWTLGLLMGNRSTMVTPICPDYSYESTAGGPSRYTFRSLGCGLGLVAQAYLTFGLKAAAILSDYANCRLVAIGGDFEAFSTATLDRLNITESEFLKRVGASQQRLRHNSNDAIDAPCFMDICDGGKASWLAIRSSYVGQFLKGSFGRSGVDDKQLGAIIAARRPLLERWFGVQSVDELKRKVLEQGAEYAAMGTLIARRYSNSIMVGADHRAMAPFYRVDAELPTIYLERPYD